MGVETIYQIKAELIAAAIVTIFRIILIAAAMTHSHGNSTNAHNSLKQRYFNRVGIVNGAQGFVRNFLTAVCLTCYTYATSALIEIPKSKVQPSNPPPTNFPLEPLTWNFTSIHVDPEEPDKFIKCRVHDSQLSCEPGFASTGHSAQGKTLPKLQVH